MTSLAERIESRRKEAELVWGKAYPLFSKVIASRKPKIGVLVGVGFGGHPETILQRTNVEILYGIDPYQHRDDYEDPFNLPQSEFEELYRFTLKRMERFGTRYQHIRKTSIEAAEEVRDDLDFTYIDGDHSYKAVLEDLSTWSAKIRNGGILGGHDYECPDFPGVKRAVDEFLLRFGWQIHTEGEMVWWVERHLLNARQRT